jgi:hypothetical protein
MSLEVTRFINRNVCVDKVWVTKDVWLSSGDMYGLPDFCFEVINEPLTDETSYSDIIVYLINKYKCKNYLEIGISVLKNLYQVASNTKTNIVAFDINKLNPCITLPRPFQFIKGNVVIPEDWRPLKDLSLKHDFIFSDALHHNDGLQAEFDNYIKDHLADKWIIIWDDAWDNPTEYIKKNLIPVLNKKYGSLYIHKMMVQEWIPNQHHPILIVSNYPLEIC